MYNETKITEGLIWVNYENIGKFIFTSYKEGKQCTYKRNTKAPSCNYRCRQKHKILHITNVCL
jgi:hypothetical protein